ncbi:chemotaxis protein CheD [Salinadaptatus halalkaliphilus]|uniref:Probable chemoreceptor glutamine deamidase CheD n=1 Tax=Salinadaptatus halalkaliphilus TaxID=2419781 RepID=A0A4S3TI15_9EURY|nr:chemotaxis protein CheD [Salinadaptatus halalkaliphilus]THE63649.1 chemotaxis protein CheD [Salinadaptatus halalkaliphilus]
MRFDNRSDAIVVGIADYAVTDRPRLLKTSGLGSCIGVAIYDETAGVSGLLHFMLPDSSETSGNYADAKFADTGIPSLLEAFTAAGGVPDRSWAKIAGGASMVEFDAADRSIGDRNLEAARRELAARSIAILETDVGGDFGRSLEFDGETGTLTVNSADRSKRLL